MTNLAIHSETAALIRPDPQSRGTGPITVRLADEYDLAFIDMLMKQHSNMVGFAPTSELLEHIANKTALIADNEAHRPVGYCLYKDRYMKREDCGNVSQLNVLPHKQRGLVGAALVQAMFERLPYGVRLFCCWCAQDLEANRFWEALGFVPLAFRTGARGKADGGTGSRKDTRMHIFWQRRVRHGDDYPYWFPSQTMHGRIGEARIVLPIPPGTHWSDAKPTVLPEVADQATLEAANERKSLESAEPKPKRARAARGNTKSKANGPIKRVSISVTNGLRFDSPGSEAEAEVEHKDDAPKAKRTKRPRRKNDPKHVAAAREVRDRFLEEVNAEGGDQLLAWNGKYDVSRAPQLAAAATVAGIEPVAVRLLDAA